MSIRNLWIIPCFFVFVICESYSQNFSWITPNKPYLKLSLAQDGIFRITRNDFTQSGINTSVIDPRTVKIYYKGSEIPLYFEGEPDGSFDANDYIDFYGTRNYGGPTTTYRASYEPTSLAYATDEYYNVYSDTSVYWIGWDGANGQRFVISNYSVQNNYPSNFSFEKVHFESDLLYSLGESFNINTDFRYFNTEKISGEGWYWTNLFANQSTTQSFNLPLLTAGSQQCSFRIFAFPNSFDTSFNEHKLTLKINSTNIITIAKNDYERFDTTVSFSGSLLNSTGNTAEVTYQPTFTNQNATPNIYFDLIEITYPKIFQFSNNICNISLSGSDTTSARFKVTGFNPSNTFSIYDIANNIKITNISSDGDTLFFTGRSNGKFLIENQSITRSPFRIQSRQVPDLVSPANGADYIVIYNRLFESQSEQLRQHRASVDNYRSVKTALDDITDIFGYGMENPLAIRLFLKHVYDTWQTPQVSFVCLMGRGSLDPKNNRSNQTFFKNHIPVYGNPPSDGYFVNFNLNGFIYYHQVSIGRLPVYTQQEAQDVVNKIIEYDNYRQNPEIWWKKSVMITGGPNRNEQILYQTQSNFLVNTYITPPPVSGSASKIYRNDSAGFITFNYADSIKKEINRGGLITNFIGHAASQDWELGLDDPFTLDNDYRMPLVLSMTCFTGRNAESNFRGFGEKFIYAPNKGAIGFFGSTGWSFSGAGNEMNKHIFKSFAVDTLRRTGELVKYSTSQMVLDSSTFQVKNMLNSYILLGDPASMLLLPRTPEFIIGQTDYRISNPYPLVGENVTLTIHPKNYGLYAKDCLIRFEILKNGGPFRFKDTLISNFAFLDTASYTFSLDTIGNYSLKVTLDYDDRYPQEIPTNNVLTLPLPLRNISYTPLKPVYNSIIRTDSVEFVGLNPQVDLRTNSVKIILQVDTSQSFQNPVFNYSNSNITGVATKVRYRIPILDSNIVYYWRTNSIINNDSTGWSETMRFVYNSLVSDAKNIPSDSIVTLYTKLPGQFKPNEISGLFYSGNGYQLTSSSGQLQVKSFGSNGSEASFFIINNYQQFIDGGQNTGINIVKARKLTGSVVEFRNFRMSTPSSSDSVLNFLNTFDTTHYVLVGIATHVSPSDSLRQTAKNKLKQFGAVLIDSVTRFDQFDSYAFIGYLNAPQQNTSEAFHRYTSNNIWTPSFANLSPVFLNTLGTISFSMGPAHRWKYFQWDRVLPAGSTVNYDVTAINRSGVPVGILSNISTNNFVNLDTLNSYQFPDLRLTANLRIDTLTGLTSPLFKSMYFKYTPPCEIIPDEYSFIKSDTIVNEGEQVTISVKNYNVGFVPANAIIYKWTANGAGGIVLLKADTVYTPLMVDSSRISEVTFNTAGLKDPEVTIDTIGIIFEVTLLNEQNDYYPFNNFAFTNIIIAGDSTGPSIDVTYDGEKILEGDLIPAKPEIAFKFFDDSKLLYDVTDTTGIFIRLNGRRIYYSIGGEPNPEITFQAQNSGNLKTLVTYKPILSEGSHLLAYIGRDKDGNRDTVLNNVYVSYAFQVRDLYNIPNPMQSNTYFTFSLFSAEAPQSCKIKIYTVAGRLIKEITAPAKVGFNTIFWDGLDNDGETMANGIYLYKLILEDDGKTETSIQKLAILR